MYLGPRQTQAMNAVTSFFNNRDEYVSLKARLKYSNEKRKLGRHLESIERVMHCQFVNIVHEAVHHPPSLERLLREAPPEFIHINRPYYNFPTSDGELAPDIRTPLQIAASLVPAYADSMKLLLNYPGIDVLYTGSLEDSTVLMIASRTDGLEQARFLIDYARNHSDETMIHKLLNATRKICGTPLSQARTYTMRILLIEAGADCNAGNNDTMLVLNQILHTFIFVHNFRMSKITMDLYLSLCYRTNMNIAYENAIKFAWEINYIWLTPGELDMYSECYHRWYKSKLVFISLIVTAQRSRNKNKAVLSMDLIRRLATDNYLGVNFDN